MQAEEEKEESIAISLPRKQAKISSLGQVCRVLIAATLVLAFPLRAGNLRYGPAMQHPSSGDHRLPHRDLLPNHWRRWGIARG